MNRRDFIKAVGIGSGLVALPGLALVEREPVRRYWQVPGNAPVGSLRKWVSSGKLVMVVVEAADMNDVCSLGISAQYLYAVASETPIKAGDFVWLGSDGLARPAGGGGDILVGLAARDSYPDHG